MVSKLFTYVDKLNDYFYLLHLFTRGRWVVEKGQNFVYVNIEWPLEGVGMTKWTSFKIFTKNIKIFFL